MINVSGEYDISFSHYYPRSKNDENFDSKKRAKTKTDEEI